MDRSNYDEGGDWIAPINRPENSQAAQDARSNYIGALSQWHRLQNRGAPAEAIERAGVAKDRAGDAWERACNPVAYEPANDPPAPFKPGPQSALVVGRKVSRPGPDPATEDDDRFQAPPGYRMNLCRTPECRKPVMWGKGRSGAECILDPLPRADGNIMLVGEGRTVYLGEKTKAEFPDWESRPRYVSHFATCPGATSWRKRCRGES